ncbi:NADPH-dependent FMN reductase [Janibacter corallicola]|uniref:NADPH-dependent FMN reductase n=1 Tax=Janibacter corallicola TaxID=415212 RepID=UPI000A3FFB25|nr:NAD(P)H-dependent oxidoreductase [Janibacter corallicola]
MIEDQAVPTIGVIVGTTRSGRVGRGIADRVAALVDDASQADVRLLDLKEVALPWLDEPRPPADGDYQREATRAWAEVVAGLDAVVIVSSQYNGGYPAPLKNALDTVYAEWNGKPVLLVTYGMHGGGLAAEQLRTVFRVLRADVTEEAVAITIAREDRDEGWQLHAPSEVVDRHRAELVRGLEELQGKLEAARARVAS